MTPILRTLDAIDRWWVKAGPAEATVVLLTAPILGVLTWWLMGVLQ